MEPFKKLSGVLFDRYLTKPMDVDELIRTLLDLLREAR